MSVGTQASTLTLPAGVNDRSGSRKPGLPVLFQDESLIVVDKPSGLLVHRGWGNDSVVAMSIVRDQVGKHVFPVHRLDRGTSGALAFALSSEVASKLCKAFESGCVTKRYLALVRGVAPEEAIVDSPVPCTEGGERVPALTEVRRLYALDHFSIVEATPRTGRLHQIRRHLKHLGHPIIGDVNYGHGELNRMFRERFGLHRLALHAFWLELDNPVSGLRQGVFAPLPAELCEPLARMGAPVHTLLAARGGSDEAR